MESNAFHIFSHDHSLSVTWMLDLIPNLHGYKNRLPPTCFLMRVTTSVRQSTGLGWINTCWHGMTLSVWILLWWKIYFRRLLATATLWCHTKASTHLSTHCIDVIFKAVGPEDLPKYIYTYRRTYFKLSNYEFCAWPRLHALLSPSYATSKMWE